PQLRGGLFRFFWRGTAVLRTLELLQPSQLLSKRKPIVRDLFEGLFDAWFSCCLGRVLLRLKSATVILFCPRAHLMPETRASGRMFLCPPVICRRAELQKAGRPVFCLRRQTPAMQLWSYLVKKGAIADPQSFIHPVPHMSFLHGPENVAFLRKRFAAMSAHHCWHGMEYTEDKKKLSEWVPLVMEGRAADEQVAATRIITGADVDYGSLTRTLVRHLAGMKGFTVHYSHRVTHISREPGGRWRIDMKNEHGGDTRSARAKFVYLGAGGGALLLLEKSGIPEGRGYGGFPVSGIWLRCDDAEINKRHHAKVYGKASGGSPPMSVPHHDTRRSGAKH